MTKEENGMNKMYILVYWLPNDWSSTLVELIGIIAAIIYTSYNTNKQIRRSDEHEHVEKKNNIETSIYLEKYKTLNNIMKRGSKLSYLCGNLLPKVKYLDNNLVQGQPLSKNLYDSLLEILNTSTDFLNKGGVFGSTDLIYIKNIVSNNSIYIRKVYKFSSMYNKAINEWVSEQNNLVKYKNTNIYDIKIYLRKIGVYVPTIKERIYAIMQLIPKLEKEQEKKILK